VIAVSPAQFSHLVNALFLACVVSGIAGAWLGRNVLDLVVLFFRKQRRLARIERRQRARTGAQL
jgi:hypothetical protein